MRMAGRDAGVRRVHGLHRAGVRRPAWPPARPTTSSACSCHAEIDGDPLDDDSLVHESLLILIGGDETTRHVISGGMQALLAHPDQRERLAADPDGLMPGAVEEMLRWVRPIKNMARTATRDVELDGAQIHAGPGGAAAVPVGQPRRGRLRRPRDLRHQRAARTRTWRSASAPTSAWATSWPAWSCGSCSSGCWPACPICTSRSTAATLPRRQANFISGIEEMPVEFTPTAPVGAGPV